MTARPRRLAVSLALLPAALAGLADRADAAAQGEARRPNVVVIITDDQGYGDLSLHGNPALRTPNLDRLGRQSVQLSAFHVMPVCAPTRACLLTGRYYYRTGVTDTYIGRAMMRPSEVTLAETLAAAGYRTGQFGKWHLGDSYPLRPIDQGFHESLMHRGGGIGQPSDPPGGSSYHDPILQRNGEQVATRGYCSDVYTDAALAFIEANKDRPFFTYLAFNAPHTPLQAPEAEYAEYRDKDLSAALGPFPGQPGGVAKGAAKKAGDRDTTARVYAMVANIDANVGRLLDRLEALNLARDTIVVFLTDNGPQQPRYNAGMRGLKGSVFDGGTRVPCFVRWPAGFEGGRTVATPAHAVDLAPTLLAACGVAPPGPVTVDGTSLLPLLKGEQVGWPDRLIVTQWHRGDAPVEGRSFAARSGNYKLVQPLGPDAPGDPKPMLFDIEADPAETRDLAAERPEVAARLRAAYAAWFAAVSADGFEPPRIVIGSSQENPSALTRQDWRGPMAGWGGASLGHWEVEVARPGRYTFRARVAPADAARPIRVALRGAEAMGEIPAGATEVALGPVEVTAGPGRVEAVVGPPAQPVGVQALDVERLD